MSTRLLLVLGFCVAVAACGKSDDKTGAAKPNKASANDGDKAGASTVKPDPSTAKPNPSTAKGAKPAAPVSGPAVDQCRLILHKTWLAARAVLAKLHVENLDDVKLAYETRGLPFVKQCATLEAAQRDCVQAASNPVNGLSECKVNDGRKRAIRAVDMSRKVTLFAPKTLLPARAKQQLASMVGTWTSTWKSMGQTTTWTIAADGTGTIGKKQRGKAAAPTKATVSFQQTGRLHLLQGTTTQAQVFFRADNNTFYLSNNLLYGAYRMTKPKEFIIRAGWDFVIYKGGKCEVVNGRGAVAKATCGFGVVAGKRVFNVAYQYPGKLNLLKKPAITKRTFMVVNKHLLHESLVLVGKYTRKK